ncbi:MAG TPA: LptA/OstA family protein [Myxococcales bacterium]|jgi:lipopolysaccharide transport protein LptA
MRRLACSLAVLLATALSAGAHAAAAAATAAAKPAPAQRKRIDKSPAKQAPERPVKITADAFEILAGEKHASWKGNVVAVRDDMTVTCKALVADYDDQKRLKKLTCTGNAHMRQVAKAERPEREAWGDVAVFDNDTAILTVTGSPRAREGQSTMQGERILFDSNADKLRVERVSMVIDTPPDKDPLAPKARPAPDAGAKEPKR